MRQQRKILFIQGSNYNKPTFTNQLLIHLQKQLKEEWKEKKNETMHNFLSQFSQLSFSRNRLQTEEQKACPLIFFHSLLSFQALLRATQYSHQTLKSIDLSFTCMSRHCIINPLLTRMLLLSKPQFIKTSIQISECRVFQCD